ncbi:MAG: hypothetical protein AB8B53_14955 [Flavobacteriales bacterium]
MKKLLAILLIILGILVFLAFTVPTRKHFESYITEKVKERTTDDLLGLNDFLAQNVAKIVFLTAEYTDVKIGSTYTFTLGESKDYKFVGFAGIIICVEGDLSILDQNDK